MVDKPLSEYELRTKIGLIEWRINVLSNQEKTGVIERRIYLLSMQKQKYLSDLKYYTDPEYREQETIYKEKCLTAGTSQAN